MGKAEACEYAVKYREAISEGNYKRAADFLELISQISEDNYEIYYELAAKTGVKHRDIKEKIKFLRG